MDVVEEPLCAALAGLEPGAPWVPMYSTVTGAPVEAGELDGAYWWHNVRRPVRFADAVRGAAGVGLAAVVQIVPQPALSGPLHRLAAEAPGGAFPVVSALPRGKCDGAAARRAATRLLAAQGRGAMDGWFPVQVTWPICRPVRGSVSGIGSARRSTGSERLRRPSTRTTGTAFARSLERFDEISAFQLVWLKLSQIPPNRLAALARYGLGPKAASLERAAEPKRTVMPTAVMRHLEAKAIDEALERPRWWFRSCRGGRGPGGRRDAGGAGDTVRPFLSLLGVEGAGRGDRWEAGAGRGEAAARSCVAAGEGQAAAAARGR